MKVRSTLTELPYWRKDPSRQCNNGWFLRTSESVSCSGSSAQDASDLCVGASTPILLFFILGGVALHERLVSMTKVVQCLMSVRSEWPESLIMCLLRERSCLCL